jgi:DnaK suppressor protein
MMTTRANTLDKKAASAHLQDMRTALLAQIAQQRGGALSRADVAADHFAHPEEPHAQTITAKDLEFALNERETEELIAIDAALARLHTGHYGQCVDCTKPIAPKRLEATPEASRCMACQQQFETTRKT